MLLDDLVTAIQTVQARIRDHGDSLSQNEYRTRISLIDPILNALGWDVSDPSLVTIEDHHSGVGIPDYALLGEDEKPRAYIEAKKLGEMAGTTKPAHRSQLRDYADELKTNYAGLTDGDHWIFRNFSSGFSGESYILDVTLSNQSEYQSALKLLVLWRNNLGTGQPIEANRPLLVDQPKAVGAEKRPEPRKENPRTLDPPPLSSEWTDLTNYDHRLGQPSAMRLPDNQEKQLSHWYQILENTAAWLIEEKRLTSAMCPIKDIVSTDLLSEGGARFLRYGELKGGMFFNKNKSAKDHLRGTKVLLSQCGKNPDSLLLKSR